MNLKGEKRKAREAKEELAKLKHNLFKVECERNSSQAEAKSLYETIEEYSLNLAKLESENAQLKAELEQLKQPRKKAVKKND